VFGLTGKSGTFPQPRKLRMNGPGGRPATDAASGGSGGGIAKEAGIATRDQRRDGWTVALRRQPARMLEGLPEGGYTDRYEIICCDCGDHPYLDYREVSPELQRVIPGSGRHYRVRAARQAMPRAGTCHQHGAMTMRADRR
jgi:hypothetical protein